MNNTNISIAINGVNESCFGLLVDINDTLYCSICEKHKVIKRSLGYNNSSWTNAAGVRIGSSLTIVLIYMWPTAKITEFSISNSKN